MDIEVIQTREGFAALEGPWSDLLRRSGTRHAFLAHEWQYSWWEHFGEPDSALLIILIRERGRLVGVAPLRHDRLSVKGIPAFHTITFLMGYEADYRDFLIESGAEWSVTGKVLAFLKEEVRGWQVLILPAVHGDSETNNILPVKARHLGLFHHGSVGAVCPYIPLTPPAGEPWGQLSRHTRREHERKLRRLADEYGAVTLTVLRGNDLSHADLDAFVAMHRHTWSHRGGTKALSQPATVAFHHSLLERGRDTRRVIIAVLRAGEMVCSMRYGFVNDDVFYEYLSAFDPAFARYSPGMLGVLSVAESGAIDGWRELDMMRGDESYKFLITHRVRHSANHYVARSPQVLRTVRLLEGMKV